ncbi:hypothetical protein B0G71_8252 [Paraburkholderia sp. BL27I4N3]|nr:hypothetical protein B0G71_8252 [Paraburkholderia sp. BL27I4N3]
MPSVAKESLSVKKWLGQPRVCSSRQSNRANTLKWNRAIFETVA